MNAPRRISYGRPSTRGLFSRAARASATPRSAFAVGQRFADADGVFRLTITGRTDLGMWTTDGSGFHTDDSLRSLLRANRATLHFGEG